MFPTKPWLGREPQHERLHTMDLILELIKLIITLAMVIAAGVLINCMVCIVIKAVTGKPLHKPRRKLQTLPRTNLNDLDPVVGKTFEGDVYRWSTPGPHTVISGATRSGKSVTSYGVLSQLAKRDDVLICGIDPSGLLLSPHRLGPGGSLIATGTSPDDLDRVLAILGELERLMDARIKSLIPMGIDKTPISRKEPAYLVVLEEYAGLLSALEGNGKKHKDAVRIVGRLLREGAKSGITVLTIIQRPEATLLHDRAQYARRVTHRLDNRDSVKMVCETAPEDMWGQVLYLPPGRALVIEAGAKPQFVTMPSMDYSHYTARCAAAYAPTSS